MIIVNLFTKKELIIVLHYGILLEHLLHHQALIKVALNEMEANHLINKNFGIAPSTIQYREIQNIN